MGTSRSRGRAERRAKLRSACETSDSEPARKRDAPLRSFGRRKGRKLSNRQETLLAKGLERLRLPLGEPISEEGLRQLFSEPVEQVWLEIGFGGGEHLVWQAAHQPRAGLIGAEPYVNGVVSALSALEQQHVEGRVRIHADDVHPLLDWLPPESLSRAFMLFPDPWPKKRHRARRLFSPALLNQMARLLRPGAEFRFASDIADYAEAAQGHACAHPHFDLAQAFTTANRNAVPDWPITRYETKAMAEGRPATFLIFRRKEEVDAPIE